MFALLILLDDEIMKFIIFLVMVICSLIMTLYGAISLFFNIDFLWFFVGGLKIASLAIITIVALAIASSVVDEFL